MIFSTAKPKSQPRLLDLNLGESLRVGDYVITVLDSDDHEVRVLVETIGDSEPVEDEQNWDDAWQYRLGD